MDDTEVRRGVVAILAPLGRDAAIIAGLIGRAGLLPVVCADPADLLAALAQTADVVVVVEEALYGNNGAGVEQWVTQQPPWSDQPFVVLTSQNAGPRFGAFRREIVARLRNVTFLERPLQALTLQATVLSAQRARRRQYETQAYLERQRDAAALLEQLVSERTRDLEEANARLLEEIARRERAQAALLQAQKIEALGQLVGGVAHDFNNLLMAVIGNLDLLAKGIGQDPRMNRLLGGAMEGARRGATLTQRLLAFARKQELQAQATDVKRLVDEMSGLIERSVGPRVRVDIEAESPLPAVTIDPNQLEMALLNLAVNARDAMPVGGVLTIQIAADAVPADGQLDLKAGRYVRLTVRDSGEGMDAETLARAVEPFFSTKAVGKGTGLGLSMVYGLAEQSGGALRLQSAPGQGTAVQLWLPVATHEPAAAASPPVLRTTPPATILLVDDDPLIAGSTVALLEDLGHRVVEANSGAEALRLLSDGLAPDLVITDYAMPGMTGVELGRVVKRLRPELPVLLATGFAESDEVGTFDLPRLAKPYTQSQLAAQLARLLSPPRDGHPLRG